MRVADWARKLNSPKLLTIYHLTLGFVLASATSLLVLYLEIYDVGAISDELDDWQVHYALLVFGTVFVSTGVLPVLVSALWDLLARNKPELWRLGQSPLEAEILAHLTEDEKKGYARAVGGPRWTWVLLVVYVCAYLAVVRLTDVHLLVVTCSFMLCFVAYMLIRVYGPGKRFLASTQYARDKPISAHDLRFKRRRAL